MITSVKVASALALGLIVAGPLSAALGRPGLVGISNYAFGPFCHQAAERSWALLGTGLPVCVRCLGFYSGIFAGAWLGLQFRTPALICACGLLLIGLATENLVATAASEWIRFGAAAAIAATSVPLLWRREPACRSDTGAAGISEA